MQKQQMPYIPYDVYESPQELVIVIPLGGVDKSSVEINLKEYRLVVTGKRISPSLKSDFVSLKEECYRGDLVKEIDLPPQVYFDKIHSKLRTDNVLEIVVPKTILPEKIDVELE